MRRWRMIGSAEIHDRLLTHRRGAAPARAAAILSGLGFSTRMAEPADEQFFRRLADARGSGGGVVFGSRICCCSMSRPTISILRPHSGWSSISAKFPGAVLLVSHDRQLLDRAVEAIAHLDGGKLTLTPGGFAEFVRIKTEKALQQGRAAERAAEQRAHMQKFVDRFRASAAKARQAQSRIKALERMPQIEAVVEDRATRFSFPEPNKLAPPMLSLDGVDIGYDGKPVLTRRFAARRYGRPHRAAGHQRQRQVDAGEIPGRTAGAA